MSEKLKALREHGKALRKYRATGTDRDWERVEIAWERYLTLSAQYNMNLDDEHEKGALRSEGPENLCPWCQGPNDHGDECRYVVGDRA